MIEPHIVLNGLAAEAIDLYRRAFHAEVISIFRLGDMPENPAASLPADMKQLVGDSELEIQGSILHVSDMYAEGKSHDGHVSLLMNFDNRDAFMHTFNVLKENGSIIMDPTEQPYAKLYVWVKDNYGVSWQLLFNNSVPK